MTKRLLLSYLGITIFVLLLLELPLAVFFQQREMDRLSADAERDAAVLASIYEEALEDSGPLDPNPALDYSGRTRARVVIVDLAGISVIDTEAATDRDFSTRPEFDVALTGTRSVGIRHSDTLKTDILFVAVPVASGGEVHGALRLTLDTHEITEQIHRFWFGLVAVAAVVLAAVAGIGWAMARWMTRPIRHLQETASRFSSGDLAATVPDPSSPAELIVLEDSMNSMAAQLDQLIQQQRAFVADASHQLRTPLTGLRLRLENLQLDATSDAQEAEIERVIVEADRLSTLVNDLLLLSRADKMPDLVVDDLAVLVADRVDTWTAVAEQEQITLTLRAPTSSVWVRVIRGGIEQVLDNLLDNAINACNPGGCVEVTIEPDSAHPKLLIADDGPGLTRIQKTQAFDRFWRASPGGTGSGLGLAIVKSLVDASEASITLTDHYPDREPPRGLRVVLTFIPSTDPGVHLAPVH